MLLFHLNPTALPAVSLPLAEEYKFLMARSVPACGFVQLDLSEVMEL